MQHVLIVDDAPAALALLSELVEKLGDCRAIPMSSPAEALAWAEGKPVDLVIVDYTLHGMDGLEFIRRFRQIPGRDITPHHDGHRQRPEAGALPRAGCRGQ